MRNIQLRQDPTERAPRGPKLQTPQITEQGLGYWDHLLGHQGGGVGYSVISLLPRKAKIAFLQSKKGGSVVGTNFWVPRVARLFGRCSVGGHCSVIGGGGG